MELPRTALNGSALMGLLSQLALVERPTHRPTHRPTQTASPIQGLGRWLGWKEAIPLAAVLQAPPAWPVAAPAPRAVPLAALERALAQVQGRLGQAIDDDSSTQGEDGHDFLPFRRHCFGVQQAMNNGIAPLRAQLRAAVAGRSARLAQLAALDAVMAGLLAPREQALLAQMPVLLDRHFNHLRAQAAGAAGGDWLATFRHDMRRLLRAELDLRLQPTLGLMQTLRHAPPESP